MIRLDFYKLIPDIKPIGVTEEQDIDCSFTPYQVFILETRLYPLIFKMFSNIEIILKSEYNKDKNRMDIFLVIRKLENTEDPFIENKQIEITEEERKIIIDKINQIQSTHINYALIDVNELYNSFNIATIDSKNSKYPRYNNKIPFSYFSKMLQYTGIDSSYNPFIQPEGIYLSFNPFSNYKKAYYEVCNFLVNRISEFYDKGGIILANEINMDTKERLIQNWNLVALDDEEIVKTFFEPNWTDHRFAKNKVDFLTRRIQGDPFIYFSVSDNLVKRHGISTQLEKYNAVYEGSYLKVEIENLKEAQYVADLIESATELTFGRVLVITASRLSEIKLYSEYAKNRYQEKSITYKSNNNYVFSLMLPKNEYLSLDDLRIKFRDYATTQLLEVGKISKFKNISPHSIIEQELL